MWVDAATPGTMNSDASFDRQAVESGRIRAATRVVLGIGSLTLVLVLASLLPGLDLLVLERSPGLLAVAGGLVAVGVTALLLYVALDPAADTLADNVVETRSELRNDRSTGNTNTSGDCRN